MVNWESFTDNLFVACKLSFTDLILRAQYKDGQLTVQTKTPGDPDYKDCFSAKWDLNYEAFFFVAANSGRSVNSYHYVNSIQTRDLDS